MLMLKLLRTKRQESPQTGGPDHVSLPHSFPTSSQHVPHDLREPERVQDYNCEQQQSGREGDLESDDEQEEKEYPCGEEVRQ